MAAVATAAAVTLTLAGCAGGGGNNDAQAGGAITYWLWDSNQQPAYQQCATGFDK